MRSSRAGLLTALVALAMFGMTAHAEATARARVAPERFDGYVFLGGGVLALPAVALGIRGFVDHRAGTRSSAAHVSWTYVLGGLVGGVGLLGGIARATDEKPSFSRVGAYAALTALATFAIVGASLGRGITESSSAAALRARPYGARPAIVSWG